jgi:hypothetical protein
MPVFTYTEEKTKSFNKFSFRDEDLSAKGDSPLADKDHSWSMK